MGDFKELAVWQRAYALTLDIYQASTAFPVSERYCLTSQLRRAAISVPSNISEGCSRRGDRELAHFLRIARGSVGELKCQLKLARDLGYLDSVHWTELNRTIQEISRMLGALIFSLRPK